MHVHVRLFAGLRERAGAAEVQLELPEGAVVRDALERMRALTENLQKAVADENYETAASLRDEIKQLENELSNSPLNFRTCLLLPENGCAVKGLITKL